MINGKIKGLFNHISEKYNLNYKDKNQNESRGYKSGHHRGRYKNGYTHPETKRRHIVTNDVLKAYMKSYLNRTCDNLEDFLYDYFDEEDVYEAADHNRQQPTQQQFPKQQIQQQPSSQTNPPDTGRSSSGFDLPPLKVIVGILVGLLVLSGISKGACSMGNSCSGSEPSAGLMSCAGSSYGDKGENTAVFDDIPYEIVGIFITLTRCTAPDGCTVHVESYDPKTGEILDSHEYPLELGVQCDYGYLASYGRCRIFFEAEGHITAPAAEFDISKGHTQD